MTGHLIYAAAQEHSADLRRQAQRATLAAEAGGPAKRRWTLMRIRTRRARVATATVSGC